MLTQSHSENVLLLLFRCGRNRSNQIDDGFTYTVIVIFFLGSPSNEFDRRQHRAWPHVLCRTAFSAVIAEKNEQKESAGSEKIRYWNRWRSRRIFSSKTIEQYRLSTFSSSSTFSIALDRRQMSRIRNVESTVERANLFINGNYSTVENSSAIGDCSVKWNGRTRWAVVLIRTKKNKENMKSSRTIQRSTRLTRDILCMSSVHWRDLLWFVLFVAFLQRSIEGDILFQIHFSSNRKNDRLIFPRPSLADHWSWW